MPAADKPTQPAAARGSEERHSSEPPRYLAVARIVRPWGVRGMVKIEVWTDFPQRFERPGEYLLGNERRPLYLERSRRHKGSWLLKFAGYDTAEACESLRDQILYIPTERAMPLPEGEFYIYQLIGLEVWTDEGECLGHITDVWETGANDVYVVEGAGQMVLLPAIADVVLEVNLERKRMIVRLMEGLRP